MKNFFRISTMFLFLICVSLGFTACKPTLVKIHADLETIKTEYFVGENQETYENAKVYAIYANYDQELISPDDADLTFSSISTFSSALCS